MSDPYVNMKLFGESRIRSCWGEAESAPAFNLAGALAFLLRTKSAVTRIPTQYA